MRAVVLDAAAADDARTTAAADAVVASLESRGFAVDRLIARELDVRPCTGCFGCWTKTPGECVVADDARVAAEKVVAAEAYAIVTPVSFGSISAAAKAVQDRLICLVLPHFTMTDGEVHHRARYARYPAMLALGTLAAPHPEQSALLARLVERNAVNLHSPAHAAATLAGDEAAGPVAERLLDAAGLRGKVAA